MSGAPTWVADPITFACTDDRLRSSDRLVLMVLTGFANDDGCCWPSIETLAGLTGHKRDTVIQAVRRLESAGRITVKRQLNKPNVYRLAPHPETLPYSSGSSSPPFGPQDSPDGLGHAEGRIPRLNRGRRIRRRGDDHGSAR